MKDWLRHNVNKSYVKSKLGISEAHCCSKCGGWVSDKTVSWAKDHNNKIICFKCNHWLVKNNTKLKYSLKVSCDNCDHSTEFTSNQAARALHLNINKSNWRKSENLSKMYCGKCHSKNFKVERLIDPN